MYSAVSALVVEREFEIWCKLVSFVLSSSPLESSFKEQLCYQLGFRDHRVRNEINLLLINGVKARPVVRAVRVS